MAGTLSFEPGLSQENKLPFPQEFGVAVGNILGPGHGPRDHVSTPQIQTPTTHVVRISMMGVAFPVGKASAPKIDMEWLNPLFQTASELLMLPKNWDSYGANQINSSSVANAITLILLIINQNIPKPSIVPTSGGNVQLEWHVRGVDLEVEVKANNKMHLFFEDQQGKLATVDEEFDLSNSRVFSNLILELSERA